MKPVLVLQHLPDDGPAYLATWLAAQGLAMDLRHTSAGDAFPERIDGHAALAVLGGEWGANEDRHSLRQAEALILQAVAVGVPVLGHCLGGQLMARALGGRVGPEPVAERGWHALTVAAAATAHDWFGGVAAPTVFQWHRDAFTVPPGAEGLAGNSACADQAFALGPHLALQFHIEVDQDKLQAWALEAEQARDGADSGCWHAAARMRRDTAEHLASSQALAAGLYARWLRFAR